MIESIEYSNNGVRLTFHGQITSNEIMDANVELINHPNFESFRYQLWIFHSVEDFLLSNEEISLIAEQDKKASEKNPHIRVAIVSDSPLVFGLGRMYRSFYGEGPWETMVFYNLDEAQKWINSYRDRDAHR